MSLWQIHYKGVVLSIVRIDSGHSIQVNQAAQGSGQVKGLPQHPATHADSLTLSNDSEFVRTLSGYDEMETASAMLSDQIGRIQNHFSQLFAHGA